MTGQISYIAKWIKIIILRSCSFVEICTLLAKSCVRISQALAMLLRMHSFQQEMSSVGVANKSK